MGDFILQEKDVAAARQIVAQHGKENKARLEQILGVKSIWERFDADAYHWFGRVGVLLSARGELRVQCLDSGKAPSLARRVGWTRAEICADPRHSAWLSTVDKARAENGYTPDAIYAFGVYMTELLGDALSKGQRRDLTVAAREYTPEELRLYVLRHGQHAADLATVAHRENRGALLTGDLHARSAVKLAQKAAREASHDGILTAATNVALAVKKNGSVTGAQLAEALHELPRSVRMDLKAAL